VKKKVIIVVLVGIIGIMGHTQASVAKALTSLKDKLTALAGVLTGSKAGLVFSEKDLEGIAEKQGYGYKYGNLKLLDDLAQEFNDKKNKYQIAVPVFVGIPSDNIQKFLKDQDFDIASKWGDLIKKYFEKKESREQLLETKRFPEGFLEDRAKLEQAVRDTFDNASKKLEDDFSFDNVFDVKGVDSLIKKIDTNKEKFMVRSTGKEDTKKLANAGGNETVANVSPTVKRILLAMRDVVASYFGQKSLTQRLGAGDPSLFDMTPFTPVLIQRMIGETKDQLPKCGVMFTEEPEGGIAHLSGDKLGTTGITVIQCAYGHNEGVVNSLIPVDTYYVYAGEKAYSIYPVIRPKTHRMVPAKERRLKMKENDEKVVKEPALNKDAVEVLAAFATALEAFYKGSMDVEFVVRDDEKTVYIVQARPIVPSKDMVKPTYIAEPDKISKDNKVAGSAIGVAGGAVRIIKNAEEVVVKSTINEALDAYQKSDSKKIKVIIVGKMAPSTSHEATTFRSEGKPVLYVGQWQEIEKWLENNEMQLVVDPQQGLVARVQKDVPKLTDGWVNYPIPQLLSLNEKFLNQKKFDPMKDLSSLLSEKTLENKGFEKIIKKIRTGIENNKLPSIKEMLKGIKKASEEDALVLLVGLIYKLKYLIAIKSVDTFLVDKDFQEKNRLLIEYLMQCARGLKENSHIEQTDPQYTKRLFFLRFLESLIYQQPERGEIINGHSAVTLIKELTEEGAIKKEGKELTPKAQTLMRLRKIAMTDELAQNWNDFIGFFQKMPRGGQNNFVILIKKIHDLVNSRSKCNDLR